MDNANVPCRSVLMIVGSLRERSINRQLAEAAASEIAGRVNVEFLDFADVPLLNQDAEWPPPQAVQRVRRQVAAADGLWIVTPEYNHGIPGGLKNLIDWLSRPMRPLGPAALKGKPVTYCGAAGSSGARYALAALEVVLRAVRADVVDVMPTGVMLDRRAFETDTLRLTDRDQESLCLQANLLLLQMGLDTQGRELKRAAA